MMASYYEEDRKAATRKLFDAIEQLVEIMTEQSDSNVYAMYWLGAVSQAREYLAATLNMPVTADRPQTLKDLEGEF